MVDSRQIKVLPDAAQLAQAAAREFTHLAQLAIFKTQRFSVALSGGSTPEMLYQLLAAEPYRSELAWEKIHFFWGDERNVPPKDANSNFRLAYEALLSKIPVPDENVHRMKGESPDLKIAAAGYEQELHSLLGGGPGQLPRLDLVLLGLGTDGHVASLFPGSQALNERQHLCVPNWVEKLSTWRLTLTFPVLNNAANVLFLVCGTEKAEILGRILDSDPKPIYPAQLVKPVNGEVHWLLDRGAARQLSRFAD